MKFLGKLASILSNTPRIVSTSDADWSAIRSGSFFKFVGDSILNIVQRNEKIKIIKEFNVKDSSCLEVRGSLGVDISAGDTVSISYKENEVQSILSVINPGKLYKVGDTLILQGGISGIDPVTSLNQPANFIVSEVSADGSILGLKINYKGKYLETPEGNCSLLGGSGSNAQISCLFETAGQRTFIEKDVVKIEFDGTNSVLYLNYPLPANIQSGKLSVDKWVLHLATNYVGEDVKNKSFDVVRDFTTHYHIPLMAKGTFSPEIVYNQSVTIIDQKIKELDERLARLELNCSSS